jgi:tRNA A37 threonylcarbamoyladenosine modification protein TsaB
MLLAIDTSLGISVAIVDRDQGILIELNENDEVNQAHAIGTLIKQALSLSETQPATLSGVAIGIGPGTSPKIDVGIAAAHGFACALGKPVVRVISHDAVMLNQPHPAIVVSNVADGVSAWTAYSAPDDQVGLPNRLTDPAFTPTGEDIDRDARFHSSHRIEARTINAGAVGMLAERLFAKGRPFARKEPYVLTTQ